MTRNPLGLIAEAEEAGDGHEPQLALALHRTFAQALDQGFAAIGAEHDPAHEVAAVAIGPEDEDRDSAHIQRRRSRIAMVTASSTKVMRKGRLCWKLMATAPAAIAAGEAAIEAGGAPPHHQSRPARRRRSAAAARRQHQAGEPGGRVDDVHEDLRQPLMSQVEVAGFGFAGVRGAGRGCWCSRTGPGR